MTIDNKYSFGQTVYLITDQEQLPRVVTGIRINPYKTLLYYLSGGTQETVHYDFEISAEKNLLI